MNTEQKLASEFISSFGITDITAMALKDALKVQGYTVVEFSKISNNENVENLIASLNLKSYCLSFDAFTYADKNMRLVFILENLSEHEQLILLAHEQGHICCGHFTETTISGQNVLQENQANEFAHYILSMAKHKGLYGLFLRSPRLSTLSLLLTVFIVFIVSVTVSIYSAINYEKSKSRQTYEPLITSIQTNANDNNIKQTLPEDTNLSTDGLFSLQNPSAVSDNYNKEDKPSETTNQQVYYITKSGTKYHTASCSYVKSKDSLTTVTKEDINMYNYLPCSRCIK